MTILFYPAYIQIVEKKIDGWFYCPGEIILNLHNQTVDLLSIEERHGLTKQQIIIELFRLYSGKLGYYLINLPLKEYYYCGQTKQDVQKQLWNLGIGKEEPR